jgi:hypothetical protein
MRVRHDPPDRDGEAQERDADKTQDETHYQLHFSLPVIIFIKISLGGFCNKANIVRPGSKDFSRYREDRANCPAIQGQTDVELSWTSLQVRCRKFV